METQKINLPPPPPVNQSLPVDLSETKKYLEILAPGQTNFTFQAFDDTKQGRKHLARIFHGSLAQHQDELIRLNQQGAGIFVTVNETDFQGREKGNVVGIRAVWMDDDGEGKELPCNPHMVVESSPGKYHKYLLTRSAAVNEFDGVQARMDDYGSDPSAKGINRVLRPPGFYHRKDPGNPHMVRITYASGMPPLPWEQVKATFPPVSDTNVNTAGIWTTEPVPEHTSFSSDEELIEKAKGYAGSVRAMLGLGATFKQLWEADVAALGKVFPHETKPYDASRADAALVMWLLFLTGRNCEHVVRLMWQSGLVRDKWRKHKTYLRRTIQNALSKHNGNVYSKDRPAGPGISTPAGPGLPTSAPGGFKIRMAHEIVANAKPTAWLIKNILCADSLSELFGAPGSYKSFLALHWGLCIASGTSWCGHDVTKAPVIMIIGEGHNGYAKRIAAWCHVYNLDINTIPLGVSEVPMQMLDDFSAQAVAKAVQDFSKIHGPVGMVCIDTVARNFGPGDENSTSDMTMFVANLDKYIGKGINKLLVHHTGHTNTDRARGSSVLLGAVDSEYRLSKEGGIVTLANTKMKDDPEFKPMHFSPSTVPLGGRFGDQETSIVLFPTDAKPSVDLSGQMQDALKLLDILCQEDGQCRKAEWVSSCCEKGVYSRTAVYKAINTMIDKQVIRITGDYVQRCQASKVS